MYSYRTDAISSIDIPIVTVIRVVCVCANILSQTSTYPMTLQTDLMFQLSSIELPLLQSFIALFVSFVPPHSLPPMALLHSPAPYSDLFTISIYQGVCKNF